MHLHLQILTLLPWVILTVLQDSSSNQWKTINNIKSRNAERVLGLGDYSYRTVGNADCWISFMHDSGLDLSRLKQTIGNHETDQSGKLTDFVNEFKPYPPSITVQYYSFNYQRESGGPKIHVLVLSTEQCKGSTGLPPIQLCQ